MFWPGLPSEHITPQHLTRFAVIYIRQSSPQQVLSKQERLCLQYALRQRAPELGWPAERVAVMDNDLGLKAIAAGHREGFRELLAKVTPKPLFDTTKN
jgi:DNA invertase Pin-like site-specific DNA recombinase